MAAWEFLIVFLVFCFCFFLAWGREAVKIVEPNWAHFVHLHVHKERK